LQRSIRRSADARPSRQLKPDEVQGYLLDHISAASQLIGTPIINLPQVAILGWARVDKSRLSGRRHRHPSISTCLELRTTAIDGAWPTSS